MSLVRKELDLCLNNESLQLIPKDLVNIIEGYTLPSIPVNLSEQIRDRKPKRYKWSVSDSEENASLDTDSILKIVRKSNLCKLISEGYWYDDNDIVYQSVASFVGVKMNFRRGWG